MGKPLFWGDSVGQGKSKLHKRDEVDRYMAATTWDYPGLTHETLESLAAALRDEGPWTPDKFDPPANMPTTKLWTKRVGEWSVTLMEFPLDDQGRPGEHGQNVAMTHLKLKTVIMSDGKPQHDLARWMVDRMKAKSLIDLLRNFGETNRKEL